MRRLLAEVGLLCALAMAAASVSAMFHPRRPAWRWEPAGPGQTTLAEARRQGARVIWVDARSKREYDRGHIPGAVLLNEQSWDDLEPALAERWTPESLIIVYCSRRGCPLSQDAAARLRREGWPNVLVLKGGWQTWLRGGP